MLNHLNNQGRKYPYRVVNKKQKLLTLDKDGLMAVSFSKEACRIALAKMIVIDELPFSFVEGEGFRLYSCFATPKFTPPSRRTIARDVYQLYLDEKKALKCVDLKGTKSVPYSLLLDFYSEY